MDTKNFEAIAHAKWILAGEHAVLRGHPALVFPVPEKFLKLSYQATDKPLDAETFSAYSETLLLIFWGLLEESLKLVNKKHEELHGKFTLLNNIPMGAGLGFSAALCVAVAQWIVWNGWIEKSEIFEFSRKLEDYFHGKSSGVDIAGALCKQATYFTRAGGVEPFKLTWKPHIYLSHSDKVSMTAQCIKSVNALWESNATLANNIDNDMRDSVKEAKQALTQPNANKSNEKNTSALSALTAAIQKAHSCFERWGLNKGELNDHIKHLIKQGALAAKSTGAGNGGYVISLWADPPPKKIPFELIAII